MVDDRWTTFRKRIPIRASVQTVYDAWTRQENLEKWFLRKAEFKTPDGSVRLRNSHIEKGDTYEWLWYGHPDSVVERRTVMEANGKDSLRFRFSGDCVVSVALHKEEGETVLELTQEDMPPDENPAPISMSAAERDGHSTWRI